MRASIRQVAESAGVSAMTVSNVLRGRDGIVAPATRERVLAAVRELDYIPVRSSVQNRAVETRVIGLAIDYRAMNKPNNSQTYEGLCDQAAKHNYDLLTLLRADQDWALQREELRFLDRRADGFIFIGSEHKNRNTVLELLAEHRIPTAVCYNREVPDGIAWVDPDNAGAVELAVDHLRQNGHTRIAHLAAPYSGYDAKSRAMAFKSIMKKRGLHEYSNCIIQGTKSNWWLDLKNALTKIRGSGATGVVAFNDQLALHLWDEAEKANLKIPRDLSIVGIDNTKDAAERGLSSIHVAFDEVGRTAIDSWVALRDGSSAEEQCKVVPVELATRKSVKRLT